MEFDVEKADWQLDLLNALAGKKLKVHEELDPASPELPWIASIQTWGFGALVRGESRAQARWQLIEIVAFERLGKELRQMGWTEIERFVDEAEFVVARDPAGRRWGIGAADDNTGTRSWILSQIALEDGIDSAAIIDFRDLVDRARIQMTLDNTTP